MASGKLLTVVFVDYPFWFAQSRRKIVILRKMWSLALCLATLGLAGCGGSRPDGLGLTDGHLADCPDSPNCVSSQAASDTQRMEALPLALPVAEAQAALHALLGEMDRVEIVGAEPGYIHAEATSRLGFVDDVEFAFDEAEGLLHFRSASRLGYGDMGVNRARMEEIGARFAGAMDRTGAQGGAPAMRGARRKGIGWMPRHGYWIS